MFQYEHLRSFGLADLVGLSPEGPLREGSDGALYGTTAGGSPSDAGTVFKIQRDGSGYQVLHRFGQVEGDGGAPAGGVLEASDGLLYGVTSRGGRHVSGGFVLYGGTVFKLNKDGSGYGILHDFGSFGDGENPQGGLIEASDGALYGTTADGATAAGGTVFRLSKDGSGYTSLHEFGFFARPIGGLVEGTDGMLYGTTERDGTYDAGTVFRLNKNGGGYNIVHHFAGSHRVEGDDGAFPRATLLLGSDGVLYGTCSIGGATNSGTVFKLNPDGSGYRTLHSFNVYDADGSYPDSSLVEGTNGMLYGTVPNGGGTVFMLGKEGTGFTVLHRFLYGGNDGSTPTGGLLEGSDGVLYGTCGGGGSHGGGTIYSLTLDGSGYQTLRSFVYAGGDGVGPASALIEGQDGMLYGTTPYGGMGDCPGPSGQRGCGTAFKVNKDGSGYRILHLFDNSRDDGYQPAAGLLQGVEGALYGTTYEGGRSNAGTIFRLNADGSGYTVLHSLSASGPGGNRPEAELIQDEDGALYGTTSSGGHNFSGTIFKLMPNGSDYLVLHTFTSQDGRPSAKLTEGSDGLLYGVTREGGSNRFGSVFRLDKTGTNYLVVHSFDYNGEDGVRPNAGVIEGTDGRLYGTTAQGGDHNAGAVYGLNKDGSDYRLLHSFGPSFTMDGETPIGGLVETEDGALYGTTLYGGDAGTFTGFPGAGTVFKLNKDGSGYAASRFVAVGHEGRNPASSLIQGADGALYGMTSGGGRLGLGAIFRLLAPFVFESPLRFENEAFRLSLRGHAGRQVRIQRSADLIAWEDWRIVTMSTTPLELADPAVGSRPQQFYRAVSP